MYNENLLEYYAFNKKIAKIESLRDNLLSQFVMSSIFKDDRRCELLVNRLERLNKIQRKLEAQN